MHISGQKNTVSTLATLVFLSFLLSFLPVILLDHRNITTNKIENVPMKCIIFYPIPCFFPSFSHFAHRTKHISKPYCN